MKWFITLSFLSGLVIGSSFGLVCGLVLGLVVGAPLASEIMAAEGSLRGSSGLSNFKVLLRKAQSIDMTPPAKAHGTRGTERPELRAETIDG